MEEEKRLKEPVGNGWKTWGPYLSERQWGTVREDYSPGGTAWDSLSHDAARSRAYRWGEDGIFGISDDQQTLCFALALWNGRDPILKERLFGLTNSEGNHGEDVKECYYYLDATPTHSYLKALYKYPHRQFPYARLVEENRRRGKNDPEFELIDTGVFEANRYFDVVTEYAKHSPSDIFIRITVHNRGPETADIHVLPQLWFRNTWSWGYPGPQAGAGAGRRCRALRTVICWELTGCIAMAMQRGSSPTTRPTAVDCSDCGMATVTSRTRFTSSSSTENAKAINPRASRHQGRRPLSSRGAGGRMRGRPPASVSRHPRPIRSRASTTLIERRRREADGFYDRLQKGLSDDQRLVQRQALAGMIWSKQFFYYDVPQWLKGDPGQPPPAGRAHSEGAITSGGI